MNRYLKILTGMIFSFTMVMSFAANQSQASTTMSDPAASQSATEADSDTKMNQESAKPLSANLHLSSKMDVVGSVVEFTVSDLTPNQPVQLIWDTKVGSYKIDGTYTFDQPVYEDKQETLLTATSDANGKWKGSFTVPNGFGGNHTVIIEQAGTEMSQANIYIKPSFSISPTEGPVGTPITVTAEGIGPSAMDSNWVLTYDNKMTGLLSAVSTNGSAKAVIRAAGNTGDHTLTIYHGYLGMPYINHTQSPHAFLPVPTFSFKVTSDKPTPHGSYPATNYVEEIPASAANGGLLMPALQNDNGVSVKLSQTSGQVGQPVVLEVAGLPANQKVDVIWNTMSGSRTSGEGFAPKQLDLAQLSTDASGNLTYKFPVPDDLGGIPHRIDLTVDGETVGQAYLRILPSIAKITPTHGPAGTEIAIEIKGVGWTEYDNTYHVTYDNAYTGYVCGFNSEGTVDIFLTASGEPGYHLIDLYPGIYRGKKAKPNIYNAPQLTYQEDHPGDALPAIRLGFEIPN
jgi:hypothetical protein